MSVSSTTDSSSSPPRRYPGWKTGLALGVPAVVLVGVMVVCRFTRVSLGEGSFRYLYSPYGELKLALIVAAAPAIGLLVMAVRAAGADGEGRLGRKSVGLAAVGVVWIGVWSLLAIPRPVSQHYLNFTSPSHDGAFVLETVKMPSGSAYVRKFPETQRKSIKEMIGTRVLSNPPGMTVLTLVIRSSWPVGFVESYLTESTGVERNFYLELGALGLKLAMVCTAMWLLTMVPVYLAARRLLPAASSLALALIAVFSPAAFDFTPGKDAAQMLLGGLQLLGAMWALEARKDHPRWEGRPFWGGVMLGAATGLGLFFGLILAWTAIPPFVFAVWMLRREMKSVGLLVGGGVAGLVAIGVMLEVIAGYNLVTGSLAVAKTWGAIQPQIQLSRSTWMMIGLPITLLFLPSSVVSFLLLRRGITRRTTGALAITTFATLAATYLVGIPYELPRLWLAFVPAFVLGIGLMVGSLHGAGRRSAALAALLAAVSIGAAMVHRAQMDVRESETRLAKERPLD